MKSASIKIVVAIVLVAGIIALGMLCAVAIQRTYDETGSTFYYYFPASVTSTVHVTPGESVPLASYVQLYPVWMIDAFVAVFWAYTICALVIVGFLPRLTLGEKTKT